MTTTQIGDDAAGGSSQQVTNFYWKLNGYQCATTATLCTYIIQQYYLLLLLGSGHQQHTSVVKSTYGQWRLELTPYLLVGFKYCSHVHIDACEYFLHTYDTYCWIHSNIPGTSAQIEQTTNSYTCRYTAGTYTYTYVHIRKWMYIGIGKYQWLCSRWIISRLANSCRTTCQLCPGWMRAEQIRALKYQKKKKSHKILQTCNIAADSCYQCVCAGFYPYSHIMCTYVQ